jgi:hypothetical protein
MMEYWNQGKMGYWNIGMLECWSLISGQWRVAAAGGKVISNQ